MHNKLNILMVCKNLPSQYKGGIQTHTHTLATQLVELGHHVMVLTGGSIFRKLYNTKEVKYSIKEIPYIPARYIPFIGLFLEELSYNISAWLYLRWRSKTYDVLHFQGRSGTLYGLFPGDTPHIRTMHSVLKYEKNVQNKLGLSLTEKIYYYFAEKLEVALLHKDETIIAVSNTLKDEITSIKEYDSDVVVISNGVSIDDKKYIPQYSTNNPKKILFVGRLENTKGIQDFITLAESTGKDFQFIIVGDGSMANEIRNLIPSSKNIKYLGPLNQQQIADQMQKADALVLPSYYETQGIVLLEAQLNGLPILASQLPAVSEHIHHGYNGLLFEAGKIWQIKYLLNVLFSNPSLCARLIKNGRDNVIQNYGILSIAKSTEALYLKQIS